MKENNIYERNEVEENPKQASVNSIDANKNNELAQLAIGGIVGAVVGTIAVALADKKTASDLNRTAKDFTSSFKSASEGVNNNFKDKVEALKNKVKGANRHTGKNANRQNDRVTEVPEFIDNRANKIANNRDLADSPEQSSNDVGTFQLYEERLIANKRQVKTGEVAIAKHTETHIAQVSIPLEKERLVLEQIPVEDETIVDPSEADFNQKELARIEIYEQTAEIEKKTFVREQFRVRKEVEKKDFEVEDEIRREELNIDVKDKNNIDGEWLAEEVW